MERFQTLRDSTYGNTYAQTYLAQGKYAEAVASTGAEPDLVNRRCRRVVRRRDLDDAAGDAAAGPGAASGVRALAASRCSMPTTTAIWTSSRPTRPVSASYRNAQGVLSEASGAHSSGDRRCRSPLWPPTTTTTAGPICSSFAPEAIGSCGSRPTGGSRTSRQRRASRHTRTWRSPPRSSTSITTATSISSSSASRLARVRIRRPQQSAAPQQRRRHLHRHHRRGQSQWRRRPRHRRRPDRLRQSPRHGSRRGRSRRCAGALPEHARRIVPRCGGRRRGCPRRPTYTPSPRPTSTRTATPTSSSAGGRPRRARDERRQRPVRVEPRARGHFRGGGRAVRRLRQRRPARSAGPRHRRRRICSGTSATRWVDGPDERPSRLPQRHSSRWPSATSTATATTTSSCALAGGELRVWRNDGGSTNRSLQVRLTGRVSNRGGVGSKVELRCRQPAPALETSAATPAVAPADVRFGLGTRATADAVRVLWPSGMLQAELDLGPAAGGTAARRPASSP